MPNSQLLADRLPCRATAWQLRTRRLEFPNRPLLMGIVNVTPDSFSDGGKYVDPQAAIAHAMHLVEQGADLLDIGGESTRPYATTVSAQEETDRILPVVERLAKLTEVPISIDTSKAVVARAAIEAGGEIVNDITGLEGDEAMLPLVAEMGAGVCVMHMPGTPQTMQDAPTYSDVVSDVCQYLRARRDSLIDTGIAPERICLDPGIGFGKTHQHNLDLMAACHTLHELGCPILVGHSRKGFLAKIVGDRSRDDAPVGAPVGATVGAAMSLARQGVQIIRVHDVQAVRDALLAFEATGGIDGTAG